MTITKASFSNLLTGPLPVLVALALAASPACKKDDDNNKPEPAPSTKSPDKPAQKTTLTVYSGRSEKLVGPVLAAFEKATGIDLQIKYADTAELAATLLEEGKNSPADVFLAQDASTLAFLEAQGMFAPLPEKLTARVPATFRSAKGLWVGISGRARVLAYNTKKLKPEDLPKSAAELTDKKWKGRVGWAPENASFQSSVAAMIQLDGKEATKKWLEAMLANKPRAYPKNTPAVMAVSRGEVDVALVNHYYLYRLRAEHGQDFPVENYYFKSGKADSLVNLSGIAVLATSKKQDSAHKLVEFLLSDKGQQFFVEKNYEFPVAFGAKSPIGLPTADSLNAPKIDLSSLRDLKATVELLSEAKVLP